MLKHVRLMKFAAAGAIGKTPTTVSAAVKTAAFAYGFLGEVIHARESLSDEEQTTLDELEESIKIAGALTNRLNGAVASVTKAAGVVPRVTKEMLAKAACDNAVSPVNIHFASRTKEQIKLGAEVLSPVREAMSCGECGLMSKIGKSLDMLGVSPEISSFIARGNASGLMVGTLSLLAA